ncbi:hypothetical protein [Brevundimonas aveniformis]|nr:hypothetical protein [Brevundimonas aveniformis]
MTDAEKPPKPEKPKPTPREEALAKALRANLRRRKAGKGGPAPSLTDDG